MKIVVVGGGIAGMAAAWFLRRRRPILMEASDRLGGVIVTERAEGFLIEGGPESIVVAKPWGRRLCEQLGVPLISMKQRGAWLLDGGTLRRLPEGFMDPGAWVRAGLVPPPPSSPGPDPAGDESIAAFVARRWGPAMVEKFAEPLLAGLYMAPAERLSIRSTFPNLGQPVPPSTGSPFLTPAAGMQALVEALRVPEVEYRTGTPVSSLESIDADRIILATPAHVTSRLLGLAETVPYVSSSTVSLGFAGVELPAGTGFLAPRGEGRRIAACTYSSNKWAGRAPEGFALARCFFHGEGTIEAAREELAELLGIRAEPVVARLHVWKLANPVYEVGHAERVARIEAALPERVVLTGAAWRGIGIPDCVRDAARAAESVGG